MLKFKRYAELLAEEKETVGLKLSNPMDYYHLTEDWSLFEDNGEEEEKEVAQVSFDGLHFYRDAGVESINDDGQTVFTLGCQTDSQPLVPDVEWLKSQIANLCHQSLELDQLEVKQCLQMVKLQSQIDKLNDNFDVRMRRIGQSKPSWWDFMQYTPLLFDLMQDRVDLTTNLQEKLLQITTNRTCFYCARQLRSFFWNTNAEGADDVPQTYSSWTENWPVGEDGALTVDGQEADTIEGIIKDNVRKRLDRNQLLLLSCSEPKKAKKKNRVSFITEDMLAIKEKARRESLKVIMESRHNI